MESGIYSITNTKSGKIYYGSSNNISDRWRGHKSQLRRGIHPNSHLQNSWNKYGENSFNFKIEEELSVEQLQKVEQYYLNWCKLFPFWSYNIGYDSECPTRGIKFGPPSEEHRRKIGLANKGVNSANYGKRLSDETRKRMSESKKGTPKPPRTEEHKKNLSISRRGKGCDLNIYNFYNPQYGVINCTQYELKNTYNIGGSQLSAIVNGRRSSHKGWTIYE